MVPLSTAHTLRAITSAFFGLLLGLAAGLIGVGGGEFRIPVLLYVASLPVIVAIAVNLWIGLLSVSASFVRRFQLGMLDPEWLWISALMSLGSIVGAYVGAFSAGKAPERVLKRLLTVLLIIVGARIVLDPLLGWPIGGISPSEPIFSFLAVTFGLMIGFVSGMLGVAGGELRIPALMIFFGMGVKAAGTVSLLVSILTVATGFVRHFEMGHVDRYGAVIAISMGVASLVGAYFGATMALTTSEEALKVLLGAVLILATVRMVIKP